MRIPTHLVLLVCLISAPFSQAETTDSQAQIIETLRQLTERLDRMEERLQAIESATVASVVQGVQSATTIPSASSNGTLVERVVDAFSLQQEAVLFPWMNADKWAQLKEGMSYGEVIAILGDATMDDPSLNRRIDRVLTYAGRRVSNNERLVGKVKFRRDQVVLIESPAF